MRAGYGRAVIAVAAMVTLAACGDKGAPQLMNLRSGQGPDEFAIVPPKALELPEDLAALPEPTPGGFNRTDPNPEADAAIDSSLYAHAARFGVDGGIRGTLASEDLDWRRDNNGRILERLFNVNVYYKAYRKQRLDQQAELARWRALGIRTSSAPPRKPDEE
jgi:Protein of unknown function (DUF3035)